MIGVHELKKQINSVGFFCIIELEIVKSKDNKHSINHNLKGIEDFNIAIEYGIQLAFEKLLKKGISHKYNTTITKFQWVIIDTSLTCSSYSACRAVFNAFGYDSKIPNPSINASGEFVF